MRADGPEDDECKELATLAARDGRLLGVSHNFLFDAGYESVREAIRGGMVSLRRSALNKLVEGVTTLGEVFRVSASDN